MRILDPGHQYALRVLDGEDGIYGPTEQTLTFVKRVGEGYPGNDGPAHSGVQTQEVLRALIDRAKYVREQSRQLGDDESVDDNDIVISLLARAMYFLELRAARRHGRQLPAGNSLRIEELPTCDGCGHVGCEGACGR